MHPARRVIMADKAGRRREVERVFGIDPAFDRVAIEFQLVLRHRQRTPLGHADLFAHQINPGDCLGYGVFDLQAGVHFDEVELAVLPQEFDRACAAIGHVAHRLGADFANSRAFFG